MPINNKLVDGTGLTEYTTKVKAAIENQVVANQTPDDNDPMLTTVKIGNTRYKTGSVWEVMSTPTDNNQSQGE